MPPSTSINTHLGTVETQVVKSKDSETGEPVLVIKTTASKLEAAEAKILDILHLNEVPSSLSKLSMAAFFFQMVQAIFLFYNATQSNVEYAWFTSYPSPEDPSVPEPQMVTSFSILWYSPVFLTMSAIQHLLTVIFRSHYEWYIARNQNPYRWFVYSFSAPLMRCMVAQLAGCTDIHLLVSIFVLASCNIQFGATHEVVNAKARADGLPQNWRPFYASWFSFVTTWVIIINYGIVLGLQGEATSGVVAIIITMLTIDMGFALNFCLQWAQVGPFQGKMLPALWLLLNGVTHLECPNRLCAWRKAVYPAQLRRQVAAGLGLLWNGLSSRLLWIALDTVRFSRASP